MYICYRYEVNQSDHNIRYSNVKQSLSRDNTIKDPINYKQSEPEYEIVEADHKPVGSVNMDPNPAYQVTS